MNQHFSLDEVWSGLVTRGAVDLPGEEPGTALRVSMESCDHGGCVHLDRMAYSRTLGWYRRKRFSVPRSELITLMRVLGMTDCLMPERADASNATSGPLPFPGPDAEAGAEPPARPESVNF